MATFLRTEFAPEKDTNCI